MQKRDAVARSQPVRIVRAAGMGLLIATSSCWVGRATKNPDDTIAAAWEKPLDEARALKAQMEPTETLEPMAVLEGLSSAAMELARGNPQSALDLLRTVSDPRVGTPEWFVLGALQGRAWIESGQPAQAVEVLQSRYGHPALRHSFPRDVLGYELGKARMAAAELAGTTPKQRDELLREAAHVLGEVTNEDHVRNAAESRVMQALALAGIDGGSDKGRYWAAKKAEAALANVIKGYPDHPRIGEFRLLRALALERLRKPTDAAAELRKIHIERAGEPEAESAWTELERLAKTHRKSRINAKPLSVAEELQRAEYARALRRVELSRRILDGVADNPKVPVYLRSQAVRSRTWTAYKQRDYPQCAADLRRLHGKDIVGSRDELLRCLERAHQYDEAIDIWLDMAKKKKGGSRAFALWEAMELSVRAGQYQRALDLLERYAKISKGHALERLWLRAWLPYRLGRIDEAIAGFAEVERKSRGDAKRARYFRGKLLLLRSEGEESRQQGIELLRAVIDDDPTDYYAMQARQRLWDANESPGPLPALSPMSDEGDPPSWEATRELFQEMAAAFGEAWPAIDRADRLHAAGYIEESRRELRVANESFLNGKNGRSPQPRSEALYVGLGWKADWSYPRVQPTREGRAHLRNKQSAERLREGLRLLSHALHEPHYYAKLSKPNRPQNKWHVRAYRDALEREASVRDVDPIHLWSLMYTESRFRRHVVSVVGARGALQIMPWTGRQLAERLGDIQPSGRFDPDRLFDIDYNARLAAYYIAELMRKFRGQPAMAYASYNGGPDNVQRWLVAKAGSPEPLEIDTFIEEIPFSETYRYTKRVLEVSAAYAIMYREALPRWINAVDPVVEDNIDF